MSKEQHRWKAAQRRARRRVAMRAAVLASAGVVALLFTFLLMRS